MDYLETLYEKVCNFVFSEGKCSLSHIQKVFKLGYNRTYDMVERMEADGFVSPPNHVGKRIVLNKEK